MLAHFGSQGPSQGPSRGRRIMRKLAKNEQQSFQGISMRSSSRSQFDIDNQIGRKLDDVEKDLILGTLVRCGGNRTWAADILGISVRTLRNKLNRYEGGTPRDPFMTASENASGDEDALTVRLQAYDPGNSLPS